MHKLLGLAVLTVFVLQILYVRIGTPPRIDGRTIKYTFLEKQCGDNPPTPFSFLNIKKGLQVHVNKKCSLSLVTMRGVIGRANITINIGKYNVLLF